jgi:hypothetical protein
MQDRQFLELQSIIDARSRSRQIGKALHIAFDAVTREPVPAEFIDLLKQLDDQSALRNH